MKRYLLLGIAVLMLVVSVSGLALTFQQPEDFIAQMQCVGAGCSWTENTTGGNSMMFSVQNIVSQTALPMTYAAATRTDAGVGGQIYYYDGAFNVLYDSTASCPGAGGGYGIGNLAPAAYTRFEATPTAIIANGNIICNITGLSQNPSYISFGSGSFDDVIWGSTAPRYIFGMPDQGYYTGKQYFLMKDILNPAASGFYRRNATNATGAPTLIYSYTFVSTFGKNSGTNETVTLSSPSGGSGLTYSTGTAYAGQIYWNLTQFFSQSTTGYGLYQTEINPQTNSPGFATSEWIPYVGSGATIQFDKNSYAVGETATLTVTISDAYYTVVTSPHVVIQDIFGTEVVDDTTITFTQAMSGDWVGTSTYTWTDDNDEGVYFGLIYATYSGADVLMNYDTADLSSTLVVEGYVKDAETTNAISGASVNVTQGSTTDSLTSAADGNYTSVSAFTANAPTTIVASKSGYETYQHVFTPLYAGTIQINLTLMPTSPTYTGIALGGIARTPPYNRTIDSALVTITNTSAGTYTATTNSAGYYIQNSMPNGSVWDIWGSKTGFSNSSIYQKLVVGI